MRDLKSFQTIKMRQGTVGENKVAFRLLESFHELIPRLDTLNFAPEAGSLNMCRITSESSGESSI